MIIKSKYVINLKRLQEFIFLLIISFITKPTCLSLSHFADVGVSHNKNNQTPAITFCPKIPNAVVVRPRQRQKPGKIIPVLKSNSKMVNPSAVGETPNSGVRILLNTPKGVLLHYGPGFGNAIGLRWRRTLVQ